MKHNDYFRLISGLLLVLLFSVTGFGINISNIEFRLKNRPGSSSRHEIIVTNDEGNPIDVDVEVGDWYRELNGSNRFIAKNAARWKAPSYGLSKGETLAITYRAKLEEDFEGKFVIDGTVTVSRPNSTVTIYGDSGYDLGKDKVLTNSGSAKGPVAVDRDVGLASKKDGTSLRVTVEITATEDVRGVTLSEEFPVNTKVTNLESGGIPVEYVNRSAADWIDVSPGEFSLEPDQQSKVQFSVNVPQGVRGTHWAAIYIKSEPLAQEREGTTIVAIKRFAVKVYVTPPGTAERKAYVTDFSAVTRSIPKFDLSLVNEGNVELNFSGELKLRDETGQVVNSININSFELLPGYRRSMTIKGEEATNLPPGKYNALVVLDYGGENKIGKSLSFEVQPLDLLPIGASPSLPGDPDGDGLYEDIDGNGKIERIDALVFSFNFDKDYVQRNGRAFDFNLDGTVNVKDAEELMRIVESS